MNKIQTNYDGNMPVFLNDIRWANDATREGFKAIASALGLLPADSFKISGCAVTTTVNGWNDDYVCTEGYIWLNGEILKVEAQTISIANNPHSQMVIFDLDVSYDPAGTKTFQYEVGGQQSHECYEVRKGILKAVPTAVPNPYMSYAAPTIHEVLRDKINALGDAWKNVDSYMNSGFENGWSNEAGYEPVAYKKDAFGKVSIKGVASNETPVDVIFYLPPGYRPAFTRYFPCYLGSSMVMVAVAPTGEVAPLGINTTQLIDLSSITF